MTVLKLQGKRHRDLARLRNQAACRLHSLLAGMVPGGISGEITPAQADRLLAGPAAVARHQLAAEHVADLRHLDAQLRQVRARLADAVKACGTSVTQVFGVGPVITAIVLGDVEDVAGFATRDAFALTVDTKRARYGRQDCWVGSRCGCIRTGVHVCSA